MTAAGADVLVIGSGAAGAAVQPAPVGQGRERHLPRAGRLDRSRATAEGPRRLGGARPALLGGQPERPPLAGRLPGGQRGREPRRHLHVQRGRREHDRLRRATTGGMAPSDFRVRTLDGVGVDWPLTYEELAPYYTINEPVVGVAGPGQRPVRAADGPAAASAGADRPAGRAARRRVREAGLVLVADRAVDHDGRLRRPARLRQPRLVHVRLPAEVARRPSTSPTGRRRWRTASSCAPMRACARSCSTPTAARSALSTTTGRA